jgi:hypothetical protein
MQSRSTAWWTIVAGLVLLVGLIAAKIWFAAVDGILITGWGVYMLTVASEGASPSRTGLQRLRDR